MFEPNNGTIYITVKEMAEIYRVSMSTAYKYIAAEGCPVVQIGRLKRIDAEAFDNWLKYKYPCIPRIDKRYKKGSKMNPGFLHKLKERKKAEELYNANVKGGE